MFIATQIFLNLNSSAYSEAFVSHVDTAREFKRSSVSGEARSWTQSKSTVLRLLLARGALAVMRSYAWSKSIRRRHHYRLGRVRKLIPDTFLSLFSLAVDRDNVWIFSRWLSEVAIIGRSSRGTSGTGESYWGISAWCSRNSCTM